MPGLARRRLFLLLIAFAAGVLAPTASSATANTLPVGAPGGGSGGGGWLNLGAAPVTVVNTSLGEAGAHVTSPVTGTIVGWQVTTLGVGAYRLHVLRPSSSGPYTEEGSTPGDVTVPGVECIPGEPADSGRRRDRCRRARRSGNRRTSRDPGVSLGALQASTRQRCRGRDRLLVQPRPGTPLQRSGAVHADVRSAAGRILYRGLQEGEVAEARAEEAQARSHRGEEVWEEEEVARPAH